MLFYMIKTQQEGANERFIIKRNDIAPPARYEATATFVSVIQTDVYTTCYEGMSRIR